MKTFWSFVAGGVAVAFLCAASGMQRKWEVHSTIVGLMNSNNSEQTHLISLPHDSETIGSHIISDGPERALVIIYRVPKK